MRPFATALLLLPVLAACEFELEGGAALESGVHRAPASVDGGLDGSPSTDGSVVLADGGTAGEAALAPAPDKGAPLAPDKGAPLAPDKGAPLAPDKGPPPGPPAKVVLNILWQHQQTGYWCGPGSTRIALSAKMSAATLPSQQALASYMGTTTNGTDHIGLVRNALNHYLKTSWYGSHMINDPPTSAQRAQLKKDLVKSISAGYAMVGNVVSGWRPPGYPSGTIYHYVAIVGYDASGDKALIADPAGAGGAGSSWANVPKTYWVSTWDLAVWIGGKGYAG